MKGNRKPRVLIVKDHFGYQSGAIHGVTTYFFNVLPGIDPDRVEFTLVILRGPHPAAEQFRADTGFEPIFLNRRKWDPRALLDIHRLVRGRGIDVLHLIGLKAMLLGRLVGRATGCANIIHLHDTQPPAPLIRHLQRRLAPWTDLALGCSEAVRSRGVTTYGIPASRTQTLHNGLPLERFARPSPGARGAIRRELGLARDTPVIGMVGRFHRMKGHTHLIRAMPRIRETCPGAVALLVGDGETRPECEREVRRLGLTEAMRFTGHRTDIPGVLNALDALVMPSLFWEGLPYAATEAAAAGVPVVGYRTPGVDEVVLDGETGLLIDPGDTAGLADAVIQVLAGPDLAERLGRRARTHARRFSVERHVERLSRIYESFADCDDAEVDHAAPNDNPACLRADVPERSG